MKRFTYLFLFLAVFIFSGCQELEQVLNEDQDPPAAESEIDLNELDKGTVVYVIDGDTFDVELENGETERIRPILVDAPEICHQSSPADCEPDAYGEEAGAYTEDLLLNETVYLEQDVSDTDRYDRRLSYVYLENGDMFQHLILAEGLAEVEVYEPDVKYQNEFEMIQEEAKSNELNLWSQ